MIKSSLEPSRFTLAPQKSEGNGRQSSKSTAQSERPAGPESILGTSPGHHLAGGRRAGRRASCSASNQDPAFREPMAARQARRASLEAPLRALSGCRKVVRSARRESQLRASAGSGRAAAPQAWQGRAPSPRGTPRPRAPGPGPRAPRRPRQRGEGRPGGSGRVSAGHRKRGHGARGVGEGRPGSAPGAPTPLP